MSEYQWSSSCLSDVGLVRAVNEDACKELSEEGVWLVADGMGGHEAGDFASAAVVEAIAEIKPAKRLAELVNQVCDRLRAANRYLNAEGGRKGLGVIGTTVAALILHGRHSVCIWAGDSRVYRLRAGRLRQLTRDHRWVEEYVSRGLMTRQMADAHPLANEITRAVGAEESLELSVEMRDLLPGDRFLICSDGLYGEVDEQEIQRILSGDSRADACRELIAMAKKNGAHDNVTVVVVHADATENAGA